MKFLVIDADLYNYNPKSKIVDGDGPIEALQSFFGDAAECMLGSDPDRYLYKADKNMWGWCEDDVYIIIHKIDLAELTAPPYQPR